MKIVVDMNMSARWVPALREAGFDAEHWSGLGQAAATDDEILAYADETDAVVLTRDLDFSALVSRASLRKPSIVHLRDEDRFVPAVARRVLLVLQRFSAELQAGAIISIDATRARLRLLPIGRPGWDADP